MKRVGYLDFLRVISIIGVIIIHVTASIWSKVPINGDEWIITCFYNTIIRWAVPILIMISGALFLSKELDINKLFKKNIKRLIIAFIFWSSIYAIFDYLKGYNLKTVIYSFITGHYHMWYLFMIIGLYLLVPVLKQIITSKKITKYLLLITLIFGIVIPEWIDIISMYYIGLTSILKEIINNISFLTSLGYVFYFILGYYLYTYNLSKKKTILIHILGLITVIITILLTIILSIKYHKPIGLFSANLTINMAIISTSIFLLAKSHFKYNIFIEKLSKYTFGIYLIHPLVLEIFALYGITPLIIHPIISVPIITISVFILSYLLTYIISHIKGINKYIV